MDITQYSVKQTSIEQIFNMFALNQINVTLKFLFSDEFFIKIEEYKGKNHVQSEIIKIEVKETAKYA